MLKRIVHANIKTIKIKRGVGALLSFSEVASRLARR